MKNGSKIFIDTAPFIYILEDHEPFSTKTRKMINEKYLADCQFFTSTATFVEFCVIPYKNNDIAKITDFETFIANSETQVIPISEEIAKYAAYLRAKYSGIKSMDAIQLATAIKSDCEIFLTNDKQLQQVQEIACELICE